MRSIIPVGGPASAASVASSPDGSPLTRAEAAAEAEHAFEDAFDSPGTIAPALSPPGFINPDKLRKLVEKVYPEHDRDPAGDSLLGATADFRNTLATAREAEAKLAQLPPADPSRGQLEAQLATLSEHLGAGYGYPLDAAPAPGSLWLDPQFLHAELPAGKLSASQFPVGTPVTMPPQPLALLFPAGKRTLQLASSGLAPATSVDTPAQYRAAVAANRQALGVPMRRGQPLGVHVDFQGGGGRAKRYVPALQQMLALGVVPTSVSGTSAGSIAAALLAAGATPEQILGFINDPALKKFLDLDLRPDDGGLANGQVAFDTFDRALRAVTGITDRPVTFADLKLPLHIIACTLADSSPPAGKTDLTHAANRIFDFSQQTTPNTPVALAVRASMAIPFFFDPVQMLDPVSGRRVTLVDGGAVDGLPVGHNHDGLPEIGLSLVTPGAENAHSYSPASGVLPAGNLDGSHELWNGFNSWALYTDSGATRADFLKRAQPTAGQHMLSIPSWDLDDPSRGNSTLQFAYDPKLDPTLDAQTRAVTLDFLKQTLGKLGDPTSSSTNVASEAPPALSFDVPEVKVFGHPFSAHYAGGDEVVLTRGKLRVPVKLGASTIASLYLDGEAFGHFAPELAAAVEKHLLPLHP